MQPVGLVILRPTRLMSGVAHLRRFHGLLWDPTRTPTAFDCRHPRAHTNVMFNGSAEYATAPNGTENASDGALKNRWGNPRPGSFPARYCYIAGGCGRARSGTVRHDILRAGCSAARPSRCSVSEFRSDSWELRGDLSGVRYTLVASEGVTEREKPPTAREARDVSRQLPWGGRPSSFVCARSSVAIRAKTLDSYDAEPWRWLIVSYGGSGYVSDSTRDVEFPPEMRAHLDATRQYVERPCGAGSALDLATC